MCDMHQAPVGASAAASPVQSSPAAGLGWRRICFTAEGHLDLSWLLVSIFTLLGVAGSVREYFYEVRPSPWWWAWLGSAFVAVLIAAVPIAKARILANSRALEAAQHAIGSAAQRFEPHEWADGREDGVL